MTEITVTHKIKCKKTTCGKCEGRAFAYPYGDNPKNYDDFCQIFLKGLKSAGRENGAMIIPRRPECIKAGEKETDASFENHAKNNPFPYPAFPSCVKSVSRYFLERLNAGEYDELLAKIAREAENETDKKTEPV